MHIEAYRTYARVPLFCFSVRAFCLHACFRADQDPPNRSQGSAPDRWNGPAVENSVVIIEGDHIVRAGAAGAISIPQGADVKDVTGKTIMPALINLHGHLGLSTNGADSAAFAVNAVCRP